MIPDIAMPAVRRLVARDAPGRERSDGGLYGRLISGERGRLPRLRDVASVPEASPGVHRGSPRRHRQVHAHELRHVCASLLIASGATDMQVANQMGHSKIETTKNIYGHLFAQDRASILKAMNQAVTRLYVQEDADEQAA